MINLDTLEYKIEAVKDGDKADIKVGSRIIAQIREFTVTNLVSQNFVATVTFYQIPNSQGFESFAGAKDWVKSQFEKYLVEMGLAVEIPACVKMTSTEFLTASLELMNRKLLEKFDPVGAETPCLQTESEDSYTLLQIYMGDDKSGQQPALVIRSPHRTALYRLEYDAELSEQEHTHGSP